MIVLAGGLAVVGKKLLERDVIVHEGAIVDVRPRRRTYRGAQVVDCTNSVVVPGYWDIHVHGAHGDSFNSAEPSAWSAVADAHFASGSSTILPTLACDDLGKLCNALEAARAALPLLGLPGVHLEGPYISPEFRGAHPEEYLREVGDGSWTRLRPYLDVISSVTLAPELRGADQLIEELVSSGVAVAAGHTSARAVELEHAMRIGLRHVSHLWSAHSTLEKRPWRVLGLAEVVLASEDFSAEVIADGSHVTAELLRIAYRCLGPERLCLVSDASAGAGLDNGEQFAMGACTGVVRGDVAVTLDSRAFCGSTKFLSDIVKFALSEADLPLVDVIAMVTTTPATVLGAKSSAGQIAVGERANVNIVDRRGVVSAVMRDGEWLSARRYPMND